jgi:hypothetical protein
MNKPLFAIGLLIVGIDAVLLLTNVIESGVSAMIAMIGIGLIATSGRSKIKRI